MNMSKPVYSGAAFTRPVNQLCMLEVVPPSRPKLISGRRRRSNKELFLQDLGKPKNKFMRPVK